MKSEIFTLGGLEFKRERRKGGHPGGSCRVTGRTPHGNVWKAESILAKTFMGQLQVAVDWKGQEALGDHGCSVPSFPSNSPHGDIGGGFTRAGWSVLEHPLLSSGDNPMCLVQCKVLL